MNVKSIVVGFLRENCYIVEKNNKCIIVDPGDEFLQIVEQIKYDVVAILVTHSHFDHTGAVEKLKEKYNVPVYDYNNLNTDLLEIGDFSINIIHTPGHTDDSITYYFKDEKTMFTGDFLFKETVGRTDLETGSVSEMENSIKKIREYDDDIIIYPGHGKSTDLGHEKNNNKYFRRLI